VKGLKGSLNRSEVMEAILRCIWQGHPKEVDVFLKEFIEIYIDPIYNNSEIII